MTAVLQHPIRQLEHGIAQVHQDMAWDRLHPQPFVLGIVLLDHLDLAPSRLRRRDLQSALPIEQQHHAVAIGVWRSNTLRWCGRVVRFRSRIPEHADETARFVADPMHVGECRRRFEGQFLFEDADDGVADERALTGERTVCGFVIGEPAR